jgi:hypothetical protein
MPVTKRKTYEIIRNDDRLGDTVDVGGRSVKFGRNGAAHTDDPGVAAEIQARHGYNSKSGDGLATVIELEAYNEKRHTDPVKRTHYFTMPEMPWKTKSRASRRAKEQP